MSTAPEACRHPIAVVAERTGLSQDVLRVWERRYAAVTPGRGPGGQRLYSDQDVERLRLLHAATRAGRSIKQVARLSHEELVALAEDDLAARERVRTEPSHDAAADAVAAALEAARVLDARRLDEGLRRAAALVGVDAFLRSVAVPLLERVGDAWHAGRLSIAQEHLATATVQAIVVDATRTLRAPAGAPRVLVATPAGERHAIGAALVAAAAAREGWAVTFLGSDLPADEIAAAADVADASVVALSVVYLGDRDRTRHELETVRALLPARIALLVGGAGAAALRVSLANRGIRVGVSLDDLREELRRAREGQ